MYVEARHLEELLLIFFLFDKRGTFTDTNCLGNSSSGQTHTIMFLYSNFDLRVSGATGVNWPKKPGSGLTF